MNSLIRDTCPLVFPLELVYQAFGGHFSMQINIIKKVIHERAETKYSVYKSI